MFSKKNLIGTNTGAISSTLKVNKAYLHHLFALSCRRIHVRQVSCWLFAVWGFLLVSCQKEASPKSIPQQPLGTRTIPTCIELIQNGDFSIHPYTPPDAPDLCTDNFGSGAVQFWETAFGDPSLIFPQCCLLNNSAPPAVLDYVNLKFSSPSALDGIYTGVDLSSDPGITYILTFDAASQDALSVAISKFVPTIGIGSTNAKIIFDEDLNTNPGGCDELFTYLVEFNTESKDFNYLSFYPSKSNSGTAAVNLDNVSLKCRNENLRGFDVSQFNCDFIFTPVYAGSIAVQGYFWDFGDGTTSTSEIGRHTYQQAGSRVVSLTIIDDNGCCTTVTKVVECGLGDFCNSNICWEDYQGHFKKATRVKFRLPSGELVDRPLEAVPTGSMVCPYYQYSVSYGQNQYQDPATYPITPPILVPGGYCETYASLIATIDKVLLDYNLPNDYTYSFFRADDCYKWNFANVDNYWNVGDPPLMNPEWFWFAYPSGYWQGDPSTPLNGFYFHFNINFKVIEIEGVDINDAPIDGDPAIFTFDGACN